ncbi:MAG TPA: ComEC/Rec2 family competence protein, partial [Spirochaetota bacterium]|nr:ComEC/Rec2 family competence protein [Spirochaetota bacterium]
INFILLAILVSLLYIGFGIFFFVSKRAIFSIVTILFLIPNLFIISKINNIYRDYFIAIKEIKNSDKIVGYISDFTLNKKNRLDFTFTVYGIKNNDITDYKKVKPFNVLVKLKNPSNINLKRGDVLIIEDKISIPQEKINSFGYKKFLFYKKVYGIVNANEEEMRTIGHKIGISPIETFFVKTLWQFRDDCLTKLKKSFNDSSYSFMLSIFFGIRSELDEEVFLDFQNTGMLHLLAISGMHIGFIAGVFFMFFNLFLSKSKAYLISLIMLFCYVVIILSSPSSGRAFLMYLSQSLFFIFGLKTIGFTILAFSGIFLVFINPFYIFDIGFQLSFFATAGILLFSKIFEEQIKIPLPEKIKSLISVTLSAFLSLFLLQWAIFKKIQFFALISSILVIPLFEYLFIILFFGIILFNLTSFRLLTVIMEFMIKIFLDIIKLLDNIKPTMLPEIPLFLPYLSLPFLIIFIYIIIPKLSPLIKEFRILLMVIFYRIIRKVKCFFSLEKVFIK